MAAGCRSCGSDQWGNVVSGIDLGRRVEGVQLFGLSTPLITTSSGAKMGKSVAGAVWLNADMRSLTNTGSSGATPRTAMSAASCAFSPTYHSPRSRGWRRCKAPNCNEAKKILATEATAVLHGREAALAAAETARRTFEEGAAAEGSADNRDC